MSFLHIHLVWICHSSTCICSGYVIPPHAPDPDMSFLHIHLVWICHFSTYIHLVRMCHFSTYKKVFSAHLLLRKNLFFSVLAHCQRRLKYTKIVLSFRLCNSVTICTNRYLMYYLKICEKKILHRYIERL
jgi:hypothetical protein